MSTKQGIPDAQLRKLAEESSRSIYGLLSSHHVNGYVASAERFGVTEHTCTEHCTRPACVQRRALATLLDISRRMELEHQRERPSEEEYQAAMAAAATALEE